MSEETPLDIPTEENHELIRSKRFVRFLAAIVDGIILGLVGAILFFFVGDPEYLYDDSLSSLTVFFITLLTGLIMISIHLGINWKLLTGNGQTIGKYLLNIRIAHLNGDKPSIQDLIFKRILFAWGIAYVPVIGGLLSIVNYLFIFGQEKRCLHDLVAKTIVVDC